MARSLQVLCIKKLWLLHTPMCKSICLCEQGCVGDFNECKACFYSMYRLYENNGGYVENFLPLSKGLKCCMNLETFYIDYDILYTHKKNYIRFMIYHIMFQTLTNTEKNTKILNMIKNIKTSFDKYAQNWFEKQYNETKFNLTYNLERERISAHETFITCQRRLAKWYANALNNKDKLYSTLEVETWIGSKQKCYETTRQSALNHNQLLNFLDAVWIDEEKCAECTKTLPEGREEYDHKRSKQWELFKNPYKCMHSIGFYSFVVVIIDNK